MKINTLAIIGIIVLELVALIQHIDGQLLATAMMLISGLAGYGIGRLKK